MVLGTHTSEGEQNYLMLAEVQLPLADCETDAKGYDEESNEVGGLGAAAGKVQVRALYGHHADLNPFTVSTVCCIWTPASYRCLNVAQKLVCRLGELHCSD